MRGHPIRDAASPSPLMPAAVLLLGAVAVGYLLAVMSPFHSLLLAVFVVLFASALIWPEWGIYAVIFSMLLSPEFAVGGIHGKGTLARGVTIRLEDFLLLSIGLSWLARGALDKTTGLIRKTPVNKPIAAYILACFIATVWGILTGTVDGKSGLLFVLKYLEYMVVFFMVVNYIHTEEQAKRLLFCLFLTCFIVCIYGVTQIPSGSRLSAPFEGEQGEPNTFGGYLVFMGALVTAFLVHLKDLRLRLGLLLVLALVLVSLVYTQSRASYSAIIPACAALAVLSRQKFYLMAALTVLILLSPAILPKVAKERINVTFTQQKQAGQIVVGDLRLDTSASARIRSWQEAFSGWRNRPILGYGVTGFGFMDAQYPRLLVETGIVGLGAFAWLICTLFRVAFKTWRAGAGDLGWVLSVGLIAGLIGLLTHALGANTFIIVRIMEPFWCVTGILIVLSERMSGDVTAPAPPASTPGASPRIAG
jgi:O-antigen ligase